MFAYAAAIFIQNLCMPFSKLIRVQSLCVAPTDAFRSGYNIPSHIAMSVGRVVALDPILILCVNCMKQA